MKKVMVGAVVFALLLLLFLSSFLVVAESGKSNDIMKKEKFEKRVKFVENGIEKEIRVEREAMDGKIKERIRVRTEDREDDLDFEFETDLEVEGVDKQGRVKVKHSNLPDGKEGKYISLDVIMKALKENFGTDDASVVINEDGAEVETEKEGRLFGIFKKRVKIKGYIDVETGEVMVKRKPWWAIFVSGEDNFVSGTKTVLCHVPPGNPGNAHTITVGGRAGQAHLRNHDGDYLGECVGAPSNDTEPGNETDMNLTLDILSPEFITYNISSILVDIDSNGDFVSFSVDGGNDTAYTVPVTVEFENGTHVLYAFANNTDGDEAVDSVSFDVVLDEMNVTLPGNDTEPGDGNSTGNESG
jgi:hypothetical protein